MSKKIVHVHATVVVDAKLINSFDMRRRDNDDVTAFKYFVAKQNNYVDADESATDYDIFFYHTDDKKTFTRIRVIEITSCARCGAARGKAHEVYCDVAKIAASSTSTESTAKISVLEALKKTRAASNTVSTDDKLALALAKIAALEAAQKEDSEDSEDSEDESEDVDAIEAAKLLAQEASEAKTAKRK